MRHTKLFGVMLVLLLAGFVIDSTAVAQEAEGGRRGGTPGTASDRAPVGTSPRTVR